MVRLQFRIWHRNRNFPEVGTGTAINGGSTLLPVCLCNGLISARLEKKISLIKHTFRHFYIFTLTTVFNYGLTKVMYNVFFLHPPLPTVLLDS
jgi:hypothetical protein